MEIADRPGMIVRPAVPADHGELFTLQRAAFVDEGKLYGTLDVPALNETFSEFVEKILISICLVAVDGTRIVGSISVREYRDIPDVERLMVAPDRRGEGISSELLRRIECVAFEAGHRVLQLTVGDLAVKNQKIYGHLGWKRSDSFRSSEHREVLLHKMFKKIGSR